MHVVRLLLVASLLACVCGCGPSEPPKHTFLTILHASDGESHLNEQGKYPGFAKFAAHWRWIREDQREAGHGVLAVYAGDTFFPSTDGGRPASAAAESAVHGGFKLPGTEPRPALALRALQLDAVALGNHDFDHGASYLASYIEAEGKTPFLSANCDFADEPELAALVKSKRLGSSVLVTINEVRIGVIGLVTPMLPSITTANRVRVRSDLAVVVNAEAESLRKEGAQVCVLVSHLQGIEHERALIAELRGVDVVVAGGGEEYLGRRKDAPADVKFAGAYPQTEKAADGRSVRLVTVPGGYRYIGALQLELDEHLRVVRTVGSVQRPSRGVPTAEETMIGPALPAVGTHGVLLADVDVPLDGRREALRSKATNLGSLIADALLHAASQASLPNEDVSGAVSLVNAGGIRIGKVYAHRGMRPSAVEEMLPYPNEVVRVTVSRQTLHDLLEHAAAAHGKDQGIFAQIGGMTVVYDLPKQPRVRSVRLTGDVPVDIVRDGVVVPGKPIHVVTSNFLVIPRGDTGRGGDGYPFGKTPVFVPVGTSPAKATIAYIRGPLKRKISAAQYPAAQTRIQIVE